MEGFTAMFSSSALDVAEKKERQLKPLRWCVLITIIGIPYICCAILFGLYAKIDNGDGNKIYSGSVGLSYSSHLKSTSLQSTSLLKGRVVSLGQDGSMQLGGGTTIYKDLLTVDARCPRYLDLDLVFESSMVMFFSNRATSTSILTAVKISKNSESASIATKTTSSIFLRQLATLSKTNGIFIGISQSFSASGAAPAVIAGQVSESLSSINLGTPTSYMNGLTSAPLITRLSDASFAASFFSPYLAAGPNVLNTFYGSVDATTLAVTISSTVNYVDNAAFNAHHSIVGMSGSAYLLVTYLNGKPLSVNAVKIPVASGTALPSPVVGATTTLPSSVVSFDVALARLDGTTAVAVFADANSNNRILCVLIRLDPVANTAAFGATYYASSSKGLQTFQVYNFMDLDVQPLAAADDSSASAFVVMFSDVSDGGRMTASVIGVTASGSMARRSADYLLSGPNPDLNKYYSWGALGATSDGLMAIMTSLTDYNCSVPAKSTFSLMDIRPRPLGITSLDSDSAEDVSVTATGALSGFSGLTTGTAYYANTKGDLVDSGLFYGSTPAPSSYDAFVTSKDKSMIMSADAFVGFASSEDTIVIVK